MKGKVNSGDLVTIEPCNAEELSATGIRPRINAIDAIAIVAIATGAINTHICDAVCG